MLNKYAALYAAYLLQNGMPDDALQLFVKHGAPPTANNLNLYRRLLVDLLSEPTAKAYRTWADLREVLFRCALLLAGEDGNEGVGVGEGRESESVGGQKNEKSARAREKEPRSCLPGRVCVVPVPN